MDLVERLRQNDDHGFDRNASHSEDRYVCLCDHLAHEAADEIDRLRSLLHNGSPVVEGTIQHMAMEIAALKKELEVERMRLAACGTAALGYFNGCADEYRSASLDDVLRLREQLATVTAERDELRDALYALAKLGADKT